MDWNHDDPRTRRPDLHLNKPLGIVSVSLMFPKAGLTSKKRRVSDDGFLQFLTTLPCLCTGKSGNIQAHHLLYTKLRGGSLKSPDRLSIPLNIYIHDALHRSGNEREFLQKYGIKDGTEIANKLYEYYLNNNPENAHDLIMRRFL